MAVLARRQSRVAPTGTSEPMDLFGTLDRAFDDVFGWPAMFSFRRPMTAARQWLAEPMLHVDEFHQDGTLVIRAELPGIDPGKDVEVTVSDGVLHIEAHREADRTVEAGDYVRREMSYGSYRRDLPLPDGVTESDIEAGYKDGILEIRVPDKEPEAARRIPVSHG